MRPNLALQRKPRLIMLKSNTLVRLENALKTRMKIMSIAINNSIVVDPWLPSSRGVEAAWITASRETKNSGRCLTVPFFWPVKSANLKRCMASSSRIFKISQI